jgi:TIR domain/Sel1 repeat
MHSPIFISHSSKDQKVARTICTALENRGHTCWIYSRDIRPGQNFQEQIVKAIRAAKFMVLVFTANANTSDEIKKELALASQNRLLVIPVRLEDVIPNEALAYEFATRQWIDLFEDWESSISRVVDLIATAEGNKGSGEPAKDVFESSNNDSARHFIKSAGSKRGFRGVKVWASFCFAAIVIAAVTYAFVTIHRQDAPKVQQVTGAGADLIMDCDRLAALPGDPQTPPGIPGVLSPFQIDLTLALPACDAAMHQYPNVARFVYQAGRVAIAKGDYEKARRLYEKAASGGSVGALNGLGYLYENGFGVPRDLAEACDWYGQAAAKGNATGRGNVASECRNVPSSGSSH